MTRVAVLQSNYVPWKGTFDLIGSVDDFVVYDGVQFTKNDWRNRNRIKTPQGVQWLTIPVGVSIGRSIREVRISNPGTGADHWKRLHANYARAPSFAREAAWLEPHFLQTPWEALSSVNRRLLEAVCQRLGIGTRFHDDSRFASGGVVGGPTERLVDICRALDATTYVSGPAAKAYLDEAAFADAGIAIHWFDYTGYPEYPQLWGPFAHDVSILDLLFNLGDGAARAMKSDLWRR
jgi:hypothetical protein